ncbi:hypothetical protein [Streptomyces sp. NPDC002758]
MIAGADSVDDMDRLRHGGLSRLFAGVRAPSTLGSFLPSFTHGRVKQLHAVARRVLPRLAAHPPLLPAADRVAYVDMDDTIRRTHGYAKQGAGYGYSKVKGLNALLGVVSTPLAAPMIAATRLRKGPSNSARGAAAFVAETIRTARAAGAGGLLVVRADAADGEHGPERLSCVRCLREAASRPEGTGEGVIRLLHHNRTAFFPGQESERILRHVMGGEAITRTPGSMSPNRPASFCGAGVAVRRYGETACSGGAALPAVRLDAEADRRAAWPATI